MLGKNYYNPDDPEQGWNFKVELQEHWWAWVILFTEALLMMGVWLTHVTRIFPVKRYGARAPTGPRHIVYHLLPHLCGHRETGDTLIHTSLLGGQGLCKARLGFIYLLPTPP
jgi:hypothetical protein